jgi:hypothetical protein
MKWLYIYIIITFVCIHVCMCKCVCMYVCVMNVCITIAWLSTNSTTYCHYRTQVTTQNNRAGATSFHQLSISPNAIFFTQPLPLRPPSVTFLPFFSIVCIDKTASWRNAELTKGRGTKGIYGTCSDDPLKVSFESFREIFSHSQFTKSLSSLHPSPLVTELSENRNVLVNAWKFCIHVVDFVLIEQMLWSQISRGMQNTTQKFDWQIIRLLLLLINSQVLSISKQCWFRPTVEINPRCFLSPLCYSLRLPKSFSLHLSLISLVSLSLLLSLFPIMIYLDWFHIKTSRFACLIIIDWQ